MDKLTQKESFEAVKVATATRQLPHDESIRMGDQVKVFNKN